MNHAWNYIVADGQEYYTDVTWDDGGECSYNMLSREKMKETHLTEVPQHLRLIMEK